MVEQPHASRSVSRPPCKQNSFDYLMVSIRRSAALDHRYSQGDSMAIKTLIMGAAGRDFHNFNTFFRGNKDYEVVAFTATQIPDIEGRLRSEELAGSLYT